MGVFNFLTVTSLAIFSCRAKSDQPTNSSSSLHQDLHQIMPHNPLTTLNSVFGFSAFRPYQEQIVDTVIAGNDAFVLMPTGGGKSLCFQIPALHREGVAIVVSPLISLMKDQVDALLANGVRAAFYNSSLSAQESRDTLSRLYLGQLDLLL